MSLSLNLSHRVISIKNREARENLKLREISRVRQDIFKQVINLDTQSVNLFILPPLLSVTSIGNQNVALICLAADLASLLQETSSLGKSRMV